VRVDWGFGSVVPYTKMCSRCLLHVELVERNQKLKLKSVCCCCWFGQEREQEERKVSLA
jgi:hypothetical protein